MKKSKAFIEKYLPSYQDAGRVNKPELSPIDPSKLSREQYESLYNQGRVATYDPASDAYQPPMMEGITITADKPKSAADFFDRYNKRANTSADHLLEAMFTVPVDYVTGLPQAAMSYMLDPEKSLTPSEALDITNPVAAFAVDAVTDPSDLVGAGLVGDALKIGKGLKKGRKAANEIKESTLHIEKFREKKEKISKKLKTPEGKRRLQEYIDNNEHLQGLNKSVDEHIDDFEKAGWLTHQPVWDPWSKGWKKNPDGSLYEEAVDPDGAFNWYLQGYDKPTFITVGDNFTPYDAENVLEHEFAHLFQRGKEIKGVDDELAKISLRNESTSNVNPPNKIEKGTSITNKMYGVEDNRNAYFNNVKAYWLTGGGQGMEKAAFAAEVRGDLLQKGILKDRYDEITPDMLKAHFDQYQNTGGDKYHIRLYDIMEPEQQNFEYLSNTLNKMPALAPVTAAGYLLNEAQTKEGMKKEGGSIQRLGYKRNSPHKNRRSININSNLITMDGVDIPLMLVPDNDEPMVALPNSGQYMFPNSSSVQEIPMGKYRLGGMPCMECGGTVKYQGGGKIKSFKNKWLDR
jgi:hypothetical protein